MARLMNFNTLSFILNFETSKENVLKVCNLPTYVKEDDPTLLFVETNLVEEIVGKETMRNLQVQLTTYLIPDAELECFNLNN